MKRLTFHSCRTFLFPSSPLCFAGHDCAARSELHLNVCVLSAGARRRAWRHLLTCPLCLHWSIALLRLCFSSLPPSFLFFSPLFLVPYSPLRCPPFSRTSVVPAREGRESRLIAKVVERVNPELEPSLLSIMPSINVEMIKLLLAEGMPLKTRRARLVDLVHQQLAEPLTEALNERVDVSMLPERAEGKVMRKIVERLLEEVVEWSVSEVDKTVAEELAEGPSGRRSSDSD